MSSQDLNMNFSGKSSERRSEGARPPRRQNMHLGDFWASQPEQVLTFSLMKYHGGVSSEARTSLRRSRYSSPHLAPRAASRQTSRSRGPALSAGRCRPRQRGPDPGWQRLHGGPDPVLFLFINEMNFFLFFKI